MNLKKDNFEFGKYFIDVNEKINYDKDFLNIFRKYLPNLKNIFLISNQPDIYFIIISKLYNNKNIYVKLLKNNSDENRISNQIVLANSFLNGLVNIHHVGEDNFSSFNINKINCILLDEFNEEININEYLEIFSNKKQLIIINKKYKNYDLLKNMKLLDELPNFLVYES